MYNKLEFSNLPDTQDSEAYCYIQKKPKYAIMRNAQ